MVPIRWEDVRGSGEVVTVERVMAGNGTIGYVEYSYPVNKDYPVVKVLNEGGYYVEPTQYNVAVALTKAKINEDASSPLYLTQNDGTVMLASVAETLPVYSFASGPTNSMRGAAFLSGLTDCAVVDIGGTTSDVGILQHSHLETG